MIAYMCHMGSPQNNNVHKMIYVAIAVLSFSVRDSDRKPALKLTTYDLRIYQTTVFNCYMQAILPTC